MDPLKCMVIAGLLACSVLEQLHPGAAMGASFGCFAFLAYADPTVGSWLEKFFRKTALLVFSWGLGYSIGVTLSEWIESKGLIMLGAAAGAAFAAGVAGAINLMVRNNGPLPVWLSDIVDRIPLLRKRNDDQH